MSKKTIVERLLETGSDITMIQKEAFCRKTDNYKSYFTAREIYEHILSR